MKIIGKILTAIVLGAGLSASAAVAKETNLHVIDVMVAYDSSVQQWLEDNGRGSLDAFAQDNIDRMNRCLQNSGLDGDFTFRLAGTMAVPINTSSMSIPEILQSLKNASDATGAWKTIWQKRDELGADLFSFVTGGDTAGVRGLGYTLATGTGAYGVSEQVGLANFTDDWLKRVANYYCFNVVAAQYLAEEGDYTMAHEIAHNMGCGHTDDLGGGGFYSFSNGYHFSDFVTVMGYGRVAPVFSSPAVSYEGQSVGDAQHDNVRTLRNNYQYVARYRASVLPVDSDPTSPSEPEPTPEVDSDPTPESEPTPSYEVLGFAPTGAFQPIKAINAQSPYMGAVYDQATNVVGVIQLKIGKMNVRKNVSKVSGTVIGLNGKKYTVKATEITTGAGVQVKSGIVVNKMGVLNLAIGTTGFTGTLTTLEGDVWNLRTTTLSTGLAQSTAKFKMPDVEDLAGISVLQDCQPNETEVKVVGGKWQTAKATTVKYARNRETKNYELLIDEGRDGAKSNRSALKLTYAPKTSTFKGSFTLYCDVGTPVKPKLKKYKATVMGVVVDGRGVGLATVKSPAVSWPVVVE